METSEKKVRICDNDSYVVTEILNADHYVLMSDEDIQKYIFEKVKETMEKVIKEDHIGEVEVKADFVVIDSHYEKVCDIQDQFMYSNLYGLKRKENNK